MSTTTRTALKAYFVAGAEPTATQFGELIDGNLNLHDGGAIEGDTTAVVGTFAHRTKISLLTDAGAAGAIRSALTLADSGTHFLIPALTSGAQTLALPAPTAAIVGAEYRFTMVGTAGQIFKLQTDASATKIVNTMDPDGDGSFTITAAADAFHMTAAAVHGSGFTITCLSATVATAWVVSNIESGLAAGTGEHVAA
tara:strand:- start:52 stop:642 length:591 start_codon:yes stop_codon:yes gene_type:complete